MDNDANLEIRIELDRCLPKKGIEIISEWIIKAHMDSIEDGNIVSVDMKLEIS